MTGKILIQSYSDLGKQHFAQEEINKLSDFVLLNCKTVLWALMTMNGSTYMSYWNRDAMHRVRCIASAIYHLKRFLWFQFKMSVKDKRQFNFSSLLMPRLGWGLSIKAPNQEFCLRRHRNAMKKLTLSFPNENEYCNQQTNGKFRFWENINNQNCKRTSLN